MNTTRVLRDIDEGILLLNTEGTIVEINPGAEKLLGLEENISGRKYSELMQKDSGSVNDDFHQMIIESLTDNMRVHRKRVKYSFPNGTVKYFNVNSSVMWNEDGAEKIGVCLSFSDVTEEERLRKKMFDSAKIFIILLTVMCLWIFIYGIWDFSGRPFSTTAMSNLLIVIALIPALIIWGNMHLTVEEVGLSYRGIGKVIFVDCMITVACVVLMIIAKLIVLKISPSFFPEGAPFINIKKYSLSVYFFYAISVVAQEFISRGMVHENMRRIIPGKYREVWAIIVSACMFGALHIHMGLIYMFSATLILGVLGVVYNKQNTIWGLCIPHFVLGMLLGLFDFVVY